MNNKFLASLLLSFCLHHSTIAQSYFQKTYGGTNYEAAMHIELTSDGGFITAGTTSVGSTNVRDIYLVKTDAAGTLQWTKVISGAAEDLPAAIRQTSDGGYIITGGTKSFGAGEMDVFLVRTDSLGTILWEKTYGGPFYDDGFSVQQTADGGFIVAGVTNNYGMVSNSNDCYVIKTNSTGDTLWTRSFGTAIGDVGFSVVQTSDGGYAIAGATYSLGSGNWDVLLVKINGSGNLLWCKAYGSTDYEHAYTVITTSDGGLALTGFKVNLGPNTEDIFLLKTDSIGNILWETLYDGADHERAYTVQQTPDGGFAFQGTISNYTAQDFNMVLVKTDALGIISWSALYGGDVYSYCNAAAQTADHGFILAGYNSPQGLHGKFYLVKADSLGNSGCNDSAVVLTPIAFAMVTTLASPLIYHGGTVTPSAFTVWSYGTENNPCSTTGMNDNAGEKSISVFPNPSSGSFILKFDESPGNVEIRIYNFAGEVIYAENVFNQSEKEIRLENIPAGIYCVRVNDGETVSSVKIFIQ